MNLEYQEAYNITKSVIKLYMKLSELEQQQKQDTKEYKDIVALLDYEISKERDKQVHLLDQQIGRTKYYSAMTSQSHGNYFVNLDPEVLASIRFANYLDNEYMYTLDGIVLNEMAQQLQKGLDVGFYNAIHDYLKSEEVTDEERNTLISFKYSLLSTSASVEDIFLGERFLTYTNRNMNDQELQTASIYIFKKVETLLNNLCSIDDSEITEQTLPMILYIKSCFIMLPPLQVESILMELENIIGLNRLLGYIKGESRNKISNMLTWLTEEASQKQKINCINNESML